MHWLTTLRNGFRKLFHINTRLDAPAIAEPAAKQPAGKGLTKWTWDGLTCWTHTKSEARARFKNHLGLKRLPVGAIVARCPPA